MATEIPDSEPLELVAGDTLKWRKSLADYSLADGWTLKYRLVGGSLALEKTAGDDGTGTWLVTLAAADTAAVVSDTTARLVGWVEKDAEKWTVHDGYVRVKPNLRTASATELQTHEVRMLAALQAVSEGRATADLEQYTLNGRQVSKIPIKEVLQLIGIYKAIVWRQQNRGVSHPSHAVRFGAETG